MVLPLPERQDEVLDSLHLYLREADDTPLLTAEEERTLAAELQEGQRAHATLLTMARTQLGEKLETPRVRPALRTMRMLLAHPLLPRSAQEGLVRLPQRLQRQNLSALDLLQAAIRVGQQAGKLRHRQTQEAERQDLLDRLLQAARFVENALVPLAHSLAGPQQSQAFQANEVLRQRGDKARQQLRRANLLLVITIAGRGKYCWSNLPLEDRIQEGNLGLMRAVDKFDPGFGARFSTYAAFHIAQAIDRAVKNQAGALRTPIHIQEIAGRFRRQLGEMEQAQGHRISLEEGMDRLELEAQERAVLRRAAASRRGGSLVFDDGDDRGFARTEAHPGVGSASADAKERVARVRRCIRSLLPLLSPREAEVVTLRLGLSGELPKGQREIGEIFGVTRARAQQIEVHAVEKLEAAVQGQGNGNDTANHMRNGSTAPPGTLTHAAYATLFRSIEANLTAAVQNGNGAYSK